MDAAIQNVGDMAMMQSTPAHLNKLASKGNIEKTAKDFEGMFMSQMLQPMFDSMPVDPIFGGGHGEEVMRSFLVQQYGKLAASSGRFGIADAVKNEMIRAQSMASAANPSTGGANGVAN